MKTCCDCNMTKPLDRFVPKRNTHEPRCRECRAIKYNKADPVKVARIIYERQIGHSINRGHPLPSYTLDQLADWMDAQPNARTIWDTYVKSGYQTDLRPSIDRMENDQHYTLATIQLMTWGENQRKFSTDRKEGRATVTERAVTAYNLDGTVHKTYYSISEAVRAVNGRDWGIASVANGVPVKDGKGYLYQPKTYKGFIWRWV